LTKKNGKFFIAWYNSCVNTTAICVFFRIFANYMYVLINKGVLWKIWNRNLR